tara:strand:+ start:422 stop:784 length:363 start_codon:yes stop_codon:yes gene_type:complete
MMNMGKLTTHVLDTMHGVPGSDIRVELYRIEGDNLTKVKTVTTNSDGRTDEPVLEGEDFRIGKYQLVFYVADYYQRQEIKLDDVPFLDDVVIRFGLADEGAHYHVPLLVSPYSFSTYRGS